MFYGRGNISLLATFTLLRGSEKTGIDDRQYAAINTDLDRTFLDPIAHCASTARR